MKHLKPFFEQVEKSEDFYKDVCDRLYMDIDDFFKEKKRFFPLNIILFKNSNNTYNVSVCMGSGWFNRLDDEEEDWLMEKLRNYKERFNLIFSACADAWGGNPVYNIENNDWPKTTQDYYNFPPDPFDREED